MAGLAFLDERRHRFVTAVRNRRTVPDPSRRIEFAAVPDTSLVDALAGSRADLLRIARRVVGSPESAEDVVQDAMVRALEHDGAVPDVPAAWSSTVVRRLAIDRLRRARLEGAAPRPDWCPSIDAVDPSPEDALLADERCRHTIRALLEGSDPRDAATLLLREAFDVDYRLIAELGGRGEPACRQTVRRALARLRDRYRREPGLADRSADRPERAVADAVLERFVRSVLVGEPAALFDALRVDADSPDAIEGEASTGASCAVRARVDGTRVLVELVLGDVLLCGLVPFARARRAPADSRALATP